MADLKQAKLLLEMARKDLRALEGMIDSHIFAEEIFGFHPQQAIEKTLKAWIALHCREVPHTHALNMLLGTLEEAGQDVTTYWKLLEYQIFAVQFRYETLQPDVEPLNRQQAIRNTAELMGYVGRRIEEAQSENKGPED